mmetsp:Transcript_11858/g.28097  ORF Transcript_11858/g.28097 Transcript_11858/m.28097 type:complete len:212 (+) Transcript_11858:130-765(+)
MTASDLYSIVVTIGVCQLIIDLLSNKLVYDADPYQRSLRTMERFRIKHEKAAADLKSKGEKHRKKHDRAKAEYQGSCADVARRHVVPGMLSSVFFLILMRILGTEHGGKVLGVLPFVPYNFVARLTARGLDWKSIDVEALAEKTSILPQQVVSFFAIYALAGLAVRFFVTRMVGTKPPKGADGGITTIMESPFGQAVMRSMGIDPDDLKME